MLQRPGTGLQLSNVNIFDRKDLQKLKGLRVDEQLIDMIFDQAFKVKTSF
jgi:hypothetical protein